MANLRVAMFCSRRKDNKEVVGFSPRTRSFLTWDTSEELESKFQDFVDDGVKGEMSRFYISINARDPVKIRDNLIIKMLQQGEDFDPAKVKNMVVSVAAESDCATEHKWMFDVDEYEVSKPQSTPEQAMNLIRSYMPTADEKLTCYVTPHGLAVISESHFDTRKLLIENSYITLKRDNMLCVDWRFKQ